MNSSNADLMNERTSVGDTLFCEYNFKHLIVSDDSGWNSSGDHWVKTIFFESPDGGNTTKGILSLRFEAGGSNIRSNSFTLISN